MVTSIIERILPPPPRLSQGTILEMAQQMVEWRRAEKEALDTVHNYWHGKQPHPFAPVGAPADVRRLALMSRINIMDIVVTAVSQTLYVEGYRADRAQEDAPAWEVWQAAKLDAEQAGVHDAALAYGTSYVTVLPGDPLPVIRGYSPRYMTVLYGDDPDWPIRALAADPNANGWMFRMFDDEAVYFFEANAEGNELKFLESRTHDLGIVPVVRFRNRIDLDSDNIGEVEKLYEIQDQIDHTTFNLKVAEHFGAFRQRAIIGWTAASEEETLKAAASRVWTFEDGPDQVKVQDLDQTSLDGYLDSRESAIRYASVLAQVPPHYLLGMLANLSAEALVAAESSLMRKSKQRRMSFGESWEQVLSLAGRIAGFETSEDAQVRWADTESRAFSATVDALTKLQTLGVPMELILERVPGFTQQDVERAKAIIQSGDPISNLALMLQQQAETEPEAAA